MAIAILAIRYVDNRRPTMAALLHSSRTSENSSLAGEGKSRHPTPARQVSMRIDGSTCRSCLAYVKAARILLYHHTPDPLFGLCSQSEHYP